MILKGWMSLAGVVVISWVQTTIGDDRQAVGFV